MEEVLARVYLGNAVSQYLTSLGILLGTWVLIASLKTLFMARLERWAASTETSLDDFLVLVLKSTVLPLLFLGAIHLSLAGLSLHAALERLISLAWLALLTFFGARFVLHTIRYVLAEQWAGDRPGPSQALHAVLPVLRAVVWGVALVFFLDNAGVKISAVVAGLGIGGVAVALAAQAVLGDLFSYIAILFDRPFSIGDSILVDGLNGTVEQIGIKTTRVRSVSGELLIFPNSSLTSSRIRNYQHMDRRRASFKLGVTCETAVEKLKEVPALLKSLVEKVPGAVFDRAHFAAFGDSSLDFEVVYFVLGSDYNRYMDVQQEINYAVLEEFGKRGLSLAYPTRTVYTAALR